MTIREWAEDYCFRRGMFPEQAKAVVERTIQDAVNDAMTGRWDDPTDDYPRAILTLIALSIDKAAIAWIEENCPQAWYKPLFEGTAGKR